MHWYKDEIIISTNGKGLYPFTNKLAEVIQKNSVNEGMCFLYIQHTSASLLITESYDPSAKMDIENFFERMVPEMQSWYRHTMEGADDSSSHIRSALTDVSISIPIDLGRLDLGTWQGVYLFEHREVAHKRKIVVRMLKVE